MSEQDVLRYAFIGTHCFCFVCGADWQGDLEAHECAEACQCAGCVAFAPYRQSVNVDEPSIDAASSPYEFVKALARAQGGMCSCGKCERSR